MKKKKKPVGSATRPQLVLSLSDHPTALSSPRTFSTLSCCPHEPLPLLPQLTLIFPKLAPKFPKKKTLSSISLGLPKLISCQKPERNHSPFSSSFPSVLCPSSLLQTHAGLAAQPSPLTAQSNNGPFSPATRPVWPNNKLDPITSPAQFGSVRPNPAQLV
ncbi:hypothetical protein CRG98_025814 [Punica granatum]|uniref:Uncharacterized protein n=1 Tax=Punica granatum TaxID=22663 RepID=A0A2I0JC28_PUNGR|nr:hypothetical protein CRG98_025814 [Punica granatum]